MAACQAMKLENKNMGHIMAGFASAGLESCLGSTGISNLAAALTAGREGVQAEVLGRESREWKQRGGEAGRPTKRRGTYFLQEAAPDNKSGRCYEWAFTNLDFVSLKHCSLISKIIHLPCKNKEELHKKYRKKLIITYKLST